MYLFRLSGIWHGAEFMYILPLPMLNILSAISPNVSLFLYFWTCRKLNYVRTKSTFQFSWQRLISASGNRVFSFSFFLPIILCFSVSLCAYFPPGSGTVKLLSSSRFGVRCHPKSLGLTGRVSGYWDTIQKARSEVISQSDVNSRGGRIWQWHCVWMPAFTAFSLKCFWHNAGHKISSHYILDSWNQIR